MILYLCRHGIAEDAAAGQADADRPLSREGVRKFRVAAKGFAALDPGVGCILTSPLLRARQTAEILAEVFAGEKRAVELVITESLAPGGTLRALLSHARDSHAAGVVAVGHEPALSSFLGELCFGNAGQCEMKKGAIAAIELPAKQRRGTLLYLLQPGLLRGLAG